MKEQHYNTWVRKTRSWKYGEGTRSQLSGERNTTKAVIARMNSEFPGLNLNKTDIDICHRLGRKQPQNSRPVIVKSVSRMLKQSIMRRKKELKGKNIYLNEDLTQCNRFIVGNIKRKLNEGERLWTR